MQPTFIPAPNFDLGMDIFEPPRVYLTPDDKLLKIEWSPTATTYHLPETFVSVRFNDLASAFHAAYGRPLEEPTAI